MAKVEVTGADEFPKELPFLGWILLALLLVSVVLGLFFGGRYFSYSVQGHEPIPRGNFANGSANSAAPAPAHAAAPAPMPAAAPAAPPAGAQSAPTPDRPAASTPPAAPAKQPAVQPHGPAR